MSYKIFWGLVQSLLDTRQVQEQYNRSTDKYGIIQDTFIATYIAKSRIGDWEECCVGHSSYQNEHRNMMGNGKLQTYEFSSKLSS